ncbi:hypothetical protein O0L34_g16066 [Tuta absoluta]|nr:hypothetical protein O0L34_g16066 [Tuta absoluta]
MSSSPVTEASPAPPSPALHTPNVHSPNTHPPGSNTHQRTTSTPNAYIVHPIPPTNKKQSPNPPLSVILPAPQPATPPAYGEPTLTPPPRSPGATPASGDAKNQPPDGTSSDKSSETAVGGVSRSGSAAGALSRKESYKAQRQHYRREKKRAATALLHSIDDPSVIVLADWLKVRGSLKSWTKLWCVLKPGLLLLYKSPKAKSSHWVGTVLLTSCQVIERPSKKDGFCFKLYHPLEQSIWAPRGPHNETIGAVVQPLPTAHLIFRAPSQAAGHCWLDGLELALRCSNAMLRCSRSSKAVVPAELSTATNHISHEELEKHFNEHVLSSCSSPTPLMSVSDYSPKKYTTDRKVTISAKKKPQKTSKWAQFVESFELLAKDQEMSSDSSDNVKKDHSFFDFLTKKENFDRNAPSTSSMRVTNETKMKQISSKSVTSSPMRLESITKKAPLLRCFEVPKLTLPLGDKKAKEKDISPFEENLFRFVNALPKRRSSTPQSYKLTSKRISQLRSSGAKTDSENDDLHNVLKEKLPQKRAINTSEVICTSPDNIVITKTAPSVERVRRYSSSSTDEVCDNRDRFVPSA